jgi:hypothetical protein
MKGMDKERRRALLMAPVVALAIPPVVLLALNIVLWTTGGFSREPLVVSESPDKRYRIAVSTRAAFPAFDPMMPALVVSVDLHEQNSGRLVEQFMFEIDDHDLGEPRVEWVGSEVRVSSLARRHDLSLTMKSLP